MLWAACGEARLMHWWAVWPHQSCAGFPREGWILEQNGSAKGNEYTGKWRAETGVCIFVNSWLICISWFWLIIAHIWVQVLRCCKSCIYWLGERESTWLGWNPATPHFAINFCLCSDKNGNTPWLPIVLQTFQFKRFLNKIGRQVWAEYHNIVECLLETAELQASGIQPLSSPCFRLLWKLNFNVWDTKEKNKLWVCCVCLIKELI